MSDITQASTLGEVVAARPQSARVFESLGLDYCCGGRQTLGEACRAKGLGLESVVAQLEAAMVEKTEERDWTGASMTELADHIEQRHHEYLRTELPRLTGMLEKVLAAHGARHPELEPLREVFTGFCGELSDHMLKEERVLFPWLRRFEAEGSDFAPPGWSVRGPVSCMMHEHDDAGRALEAMRELTDGFAPPADACGTYRALLAGLGELERDMHAHVHKENSILFPKAIQAEARAPEQAGNACSCRAQGTEAGHACHARLDT